MAQSMLITRFNEIKVEDEYINVRAKVIRKWERPDLYSKKSGLFAIDMILLDDQSNVIQATIRKALIRKFQKTIEQGNEYNFTNMEVAENTGSDVNRVSVYHKHRLYFSFITRVDHQRTPSILHHGFRFSKFQDILDKNVSDRHYLDVIGELTGCSKVTLSKNKGEKLRTVELTDLTKTVLKCSVWGDYTDDFSFVDDWHCSEPMICIMQNVQRTTYNGEVRITTTRYATQIGYNKEIPEVEEYRERNRDLPASSESRISELSHDSYDLIRPELIRTITEIVKSGKAGYWVTLATIMNIDLEGHWYYMSCKNCYKGATKGEDGKLECKEKCLGEKQTTIIPRFQTKFVVRDSSGGSAKVTMFETHISKEIKMSASEILDRQDQSDDAPEELEVFIGREFVFKLEVSRKWNVDGNRTSYTVVNMTDDKNIIARWKDAHAKIKEDQLEHDSGLNMADKANNGGTQLDTDQASIDVTPPLKRPLSRIIEDITGEDSEDEITTADQLSTTKRQVKVKVEKV